MALESFYGGRQGVSPVIKARFEFITKKDEAYQAKLNTKNLLLTDWEKHVLKHYNKFSEEWKVENEDKYIMPIWSSEFLDLFVMDEQFKKVDYTDVWYDELCIIDTPNKMNPNNGKIFRRTLKRYENPQLTGISDERAIYAEYVGQIVGPSGGVPNLVFGNLDDVRKDAAGRYKDSNQNDLYYKVENWDYLYPNANEEGNPITSVNIRNYNDDDEINHDDEIDDYQQAAANDYQHIAILNSGDNNNITIVPGKNSDGTFNDKIRYTWCNVRRNLNHAFNDTTNPDYEDEAWIYLGFEIPYTSWDVSATHIPYWLNTDGVGNIVDIQKSNETDNDPDHPFYHNLRFYIPRGTRGIGPEEIVLVKNKDRDHPKDSEGNSIPLYNIGAILYNSSNDTYSLDTGQLHIDSLPDSYWIAKWTLYNPSQKDFEGSATNTNFTNNTKTDTSTYQEVWIYLGEYKDITSIKYDDNTGKIQIQYSNLANWIPIDGEINYARTLRVETNPTAIDTDGNSTYGKIYKVSNISNKNNQTLFNTDIKVEEPTGDTLPLIKSVTSNAGALTFNYSGIGDIEAQGKIREIVDFSSTEAGHLLITFNEKLPAEYGKTPVNEEPPYKYTYDFTNVYGQGLTGMNNIYFEKEQDNSTQILPDQDAINVTVTFFKSSSDDTTNGLAKIWENPSNNSNGS